MHVHQKLSEITSKGRLNGSLALVLLSVLYVSINLYVQLSVICVRENAVHCIDKCVPTVCRGLTDESEILKFLQHGTLVGLLPVPHPILIRKYQANSGTAMWFRTYMWGVIYLR